ncbi:MAG: dienelactone hydrolase family protein [Candidatus Obscuribacterales bacterium]|nr:dienelactone hydrolase family protein [Candidatus Obscuribacterales bacterium]
MTDKRIKIEGCLDAGIGGTAKRGSVLLSAGAGGDMDTPLLFKTATQLQNLGFLTLRWNYSYVARKGVASSGGKREIKEMESVLNYLRTVASGKPLILLGKSFGARLSTYIGASNDNIDGYALYGLPLQGLSPQSKRRDWSHMSKLKAPVIFITGAKDRLCPLSELTEVQELLKAPYSSFVVEGDHSYKPHGENEALKLMSHWFDKTF